MSCKDCLHYEICEALYEMNGISKIFPSQCAFYKNNKMNNWISVKDRLPEEHDSLFEQLYGTDKWNDAMYRTTSNYVLATLEFEDGTKRVTMIRTRSGIWDVSSVRKAKVTHWMPLPEPPKGEEK